MNFSYLRYTDKIYSRTFSKHYDIEDFAESITVNENTDYIDEYDRIDEPLEEIEFAEKAYDILTGEDKDKRKKIIEHLYLVDINEEVLKDLDLDIKDGSLLKDVISVLDFYDYVCMKIEEINDKMAESLEVLERQWEKELAWQNEEYYRSIL